MPERKMRVIKFAHFDGNFIAIQIDDQISNGL